jgi:branched-chain amino acid transport system ATP-binding protein
VTATISASQPSFGGAEEPLLACQGVEVAYGTVQVLFGVDIEVRRGEIVALLGTNGAGKSTLLRAISQLIDPIAGRITFEGRDVTHAGPLATARAGIVQVPGGKAIFPTLTVAEHFEAGRWLLGNQDPAEVDTRQEQVLERFPRLRERWTQRAGDLSGGEQQQLALSTAFIAKPTLLIIDELSLGLAPVVVEELLDLVRTIHAEGTTVMIVEQSVNVALTLADRAYFMEKGEVRFSGPTRDLLSRGDILRSVFLAGAARASGPAAPVAARAPAPSGDETSGGVALSVAGLTRRFGGITAVNGVGFDLERNAVLGLIGPNGAGKTTIFDLISGLLPVDEGSVALGGIDVTSWTPDRRAMAGLGRSFQDARIFPSLTVAENLAIGLERHLTDRDHVAALFALPAIREMEAHVAYTVEDLIELMSLGAYRDKFVSELSTGTRRVVDLGMAIAHEPGVLLLDEPSSGIAQRETEALAPLIRRIQSEIGCAILIIEHDMPLIRSVSDHIVALDQGTIIAVGTPDTVLADPEVIRSYLGGDGGVVVERSTMGPDEKVPARRRRRAK